MMTCGCGSRRRLQPCLDSRAAASVLACSIAACLPLAAAAHLPAEVAAQRSHAMCPLPGRDEQALLLDQPAQWSAWLAAGESQALGRAVDWRHERVLVVALAQQSTAGVGVALAPEVPHGERGALSARLLVTRPGAGEMAAMVMTRPCVVAAIPRGSWRSVKVQTEGGSLEATLMKTAERPQSSSNGTAQAGQAPVLPASSPPLGGVPLIIPVPAR